MRVERSPGELRLKFFDLFALVVAGVGFRLLAGPVDFSDTNRPVFQIGREPRGRVPRRVITVAFVAIDPILAKPFESLAGGFGTGRQQIGFRFVETEIRERWQRAGINADRVGVGERGSVGSGVGVVLLAVVPLPTEVSKDGVGVAVVGRDRPRLVADRVVEGLAGDVGVGEGLSNRGVAFAR